MHAYRDHDRLEPLEEAVTSKSRTPRRKRPIVAWSISLLFLLLGVAFLYRNRPFDTTNRMKSPVGNGVALRVLPLGDSITEGYGSSDHNGYRLLLLEMLKDSGSQNVNFVGSQENGVNNAENHHEGHGGFVIREITDFLKEHDEVLREKPNVILLHAGTNDIDRDPPELPYDEAPQRLGALMDLVLKECPDAVLLVAQIINATNSQSRIDAFNAQIPSLVKTRRSKDFKVRAVDHTNVGGTDLADGLHPNDSGYKIMAKNWFRAMEDVPKGWIQKPQ